MRWATAPAAAPPVESRAIMAQRPIAQSVPAVGVAVAAMLTGRASILHPRWLRAEGYLQGGVADALILIGRLLIEKAAEWGEELWLAKADLEYAFGAIRH